MAWLAALSAYAAPPRRLSQQERHEAAERFDRAMAFLDEGNDRAALAELARLYKRTRHPRVLYNAALLYERMSRPVEALRALEEVLAHPGDLPQRVVAIARRMRDAQAQRVAHLEISTSVSAQIEVDGVRVARTPLSVPLAVAAGRVLLTLSAPGHLPVRKELTVAGQTVERLHVELLPTDRRMAHLAVKTQVPGADVFVDGRPAGRTPLPATLLVQPGRRRIEVRRAGYQTARKDVTLDDGASAELELDLALDPHAPVGGLLRIEVTEPGADVFIDGQVHASERGTWRIPEGPHTLRVERAGFLPRQRTVRVPRGAATYVRVTLAPTAETRRAYERRVGLQRTLAWVGILAGSALVLGAGTWWLLNEPQLDEAQAQRSVAEGKLESGPPPCGPGSDATTPARRQCEADLRRADDEVNLHKNLRTASLIGVGLGALSAAMGVVLFAIAGDPDRYRRRPTPLPGRWELSGSVAPGGGGIWLNGWF